MYSPLTDQSHRLLRLLITDPSVALTEAREMLGMSPGELTSALEQLRDVGLVRELEGQAEVLTLVPDAILARMVSLQEEAAQARLEELKRTGATLSVLSESLMRLQATEGGLPHTSKLVGGREISAALEGIATRARREILSMHPGSPLPPAMLKDSMKRNREVLERGVAMRSIHLSAMLKVPHGRAHLEELQEAGAEVRVASVLPFRLIVVDRVVAYAPAGTADTDAGAGSGDMTALEIRDRSLIDLFRSVFEFCWIHGASAPLAGGHDVDDADEDLDSRELSLLRMLGQGLKDDAIARSLGISSRTLRRMMTDVMRKLNADSRFQAGAQAVARGWLDM
ncbi:LuxR C-terminal-related transcriptional regulator [Streptomyces sp. NPDC014006]|uniref:helix-turn-helix transcriptional regulator n=1 Tax=Streptomyces sp. NPDC014006 TaxID=3364870 RepID=UPI0036F6AF4B